MKKSNVNHFSVSHQGRRKSNEDNVMVQINSKFKPDQTILAVADGMGGYEKGDVAARIIIDQLEKLSKEEIPLDFNQAAEMVRKHLAEANQIIFETAAKETKGSMGTTVSGAIIKANHCLFFNVGDSRTYLLNHEGINQVTEDHSADVDAYKKGIINKDEIGEGYYSHALTRSIGTDPEMEVDIFPQNDFFILQSGDVVLACTDGMWNSISAKEIFREVVGRNNLEESLQSLSSLSFAKGSVDNISAVAYEFGQLKRKDLQLKKYPRLPEIEQGRKRKKNLMLPALLGAALVVLAILVVLIVAGLKTEIEPVPDDQRQSRDRTQLRRDLNTLDAEQKFDSESEGGSVIFRPSGGQHPGGVQVELKTLSLVSQRGDKIPTTTHYTINGGEPTKSSPEYRGKIALSGIGKSFVIRAKAFSTIGSYEAQRSFLQRYTIVKRRPAVFTQTNHRQLHPRTRTEIFDQTKKILINIAQNRVVVYNNRQRVYGDVIKSFQCRGARMLLSINPQGQADLSQVKFSGMKVVPSDIEQIIRRSLAERISRMKFSPPLNLRGNSVRVKIWIDFKKVARKESKIIFFR